jgi:hypothetical protein
LGIFSVGDDTSIELAAKNGSIKYITSVDYQYTDILGIIGTQTVIVSGTKEAPLTSEIKSNQVVEKIAEKSVSKSTEIPVEKPIEKTIVETGNKIAEKVNETEDQLNRNIKTNSAKNNQALQIIPFQIHKKTILLMKNLHLKLQM